MNCNGILYFYHGTMGAGKSLRLLATACNFENQNIPFIIFKSSIDTRDGQDIIHSRAVGDKECVSIDPDVDIFDSVTKMINVSSVCGVEPIKYILVDEAQFLTARQVDELAAVVDQYGINVKCYGLRTDFKTHLFEGSKRLFEVADVIEKIESNCCCGNETLFNARVDKDGNVATRGTQIEIGGDESYSAMCRKCYYEKTNNPLYRAKNKSIDE